MCVCVCTHFIDRQKNRDRASEREGDFIWVKWKLFKLSQVLFFQKAIHFSPSAPEVSSEPIRCSQEASLNA